MQRLGRGLANADDLSPFFITGHSHKFGATVPDEQVPHHAAEASHGERHQPIEAGGDSDQAGS